MAAAGATDGSAAAAVGVGVLFPGADVGDECAPAAAGDATAAAATAPLRTGAGDGSAATISEWMPLRAVREVDDGFGSWLLLLTALGSLLQPPALIPADAPSVVKVYRFVRGGGVEAAVTEHQTVDEFMGRAKAVSCTEFSALDAKRMTRLRVAGMLGQGSYGAVQVGVLESGAEAWFVAVKTRLWIAPPLTEGGGCLAYHGKRKHIPPDSGTHSEADREEFTSGLRPFDALRVATTSAELEGRLLEERGRVPNWVVPISKSGYGAIIMPVLRAVSEEAEHSSDLTPFLDETKKYLPLTGAGRMYAPHELVFDGTGLRHIMRDRVGQLCCVDWGLLASECRKRLKSGDDQAMRPSEA